MNRAGTHKDVSCELTPRAEGSKVLSGLGGHHSSLEVSAGCMGQVEIRGEGVLAIANTQDTNVTPAVLGTVETLGDFVLI